MTVNNSTTMSPRPSGGGVTFRVIQDMAHHYLDLSWYPIPLRTDAKAPSLKNWPQLRIAPEEVDEFFPTGTNIGLLTGFPSGNLTDIDLDSQEAVLVAPLLLPNTSMVHGRTTAPGRHYWYKCDRNEPTTRFKAPDGTCLIEIRSGTAEKPSVTMVPPSIHPDTGESLIWAGPLDPAFIPYDVLLESVIDVAVASLLIKSWNHGRRHELALAFSGYLAVGGIPEERAYRLVNAICHGTSDGEAYDRLQAVKTTYQALQAGNSITGRTELQKIIGLETVKCLDKWLNVHSSSHANSFTSPSITHDRFENTDLGNAKRLISRFGHQIRYVSAWGWLYWDGKRWARDDLGMVKQYACEIVEGMLENADGSIPVKDKLQILKWQQQSQGHSKLKAMLEIATYQKKVVSTPQHFDAHPWLFNVQNGTLDLKSGHLLPHNPDDMITKVAPVGYIPSALCPLFHEFLDRIFSGDVELIHFVQKALGHTLIGGNPEQVLIILFGNGANGKSVLVNTIMDILGRDYAQQMNGETLMMKTSNGMPRNDLACLEGVRFTAVSETGDKNRLDEALVKQITGGERIRARYLYHEEFEFLPQFSIVLSTNHKPYIADQGHSIWRRIRLIPFNVTISKEEQDPDLKQKLLQEKEGIFSWLAEGCRLYLTEGLIEPKTVRLATESYRNEMDTLGQFLEEQMEIVPTGKIQSQQLYNAYRNWCEEMGLRPVNQKELTRRLEARGFTRSRDGCGVHWIGITSKPVDDMDVLESGFPPVISFFEVEM